MNRITDLAAEKYMPGQLGNKLLIQWCLASAAGI